MRLVEDVSDRASFSSCALAGPVATLAARIPAERPGLFVRAKTMEAQVQRELGHPEIASDLHEEVLAMLRGPEARWVPHSERCFAWRHAAMTYRMLGRFEDATLVAAQASEEATDGAQRRDFIFSLGTQGLVALAADKPEEALRFQAQAFEHARDYDEVLAPLPRRRVGASRSPRRSSRGLQPNARHR